MFSWEMTLCAAIVNGTTNRWFHLIRFRLLHLCCVMYEKYSKTLNCVIEELFFYIIFYGIYRAFKSTFIEERLPLLAHERKWSKCMYSFCYCWVEPRIREWTRGFGTLWDSWRVLQYLLLSSGDWHGAGYELLVISGGYRAPVGRSGE